MTSRERFVSAINHIQPDRPPVDIGATSVTGIHARALVSLRRALGLPERPVKVYEVLQQLGWVELDDIAAFGCDVAGLMPFANFAGNRNDGGWKPYDNPFGLDALCAATLAQSSGADGRRYLYPQGDMSLPPSMVMPDGGYFFDCLDRGGATAEESGDAAEDFAESFPVMSGEEAEFYARQADFLYQNTDLGVIGTLAPAGFGDFAFLPGAGLRSPRGVRNAEEWIVVHKINPRYVHDLFELQTRRALENLEIYRQAVGERIQVIFMGGTDFGTQCGLMMSPEDFRTFYMPYWVRVNDWVHKNTGWKTFYHSCGAVEPLISLFIEAGADILNPVQCSAAGMDAGTLKKKYGEKLVFWGGGVDTQRILPFGGPDEVRACVRERMDIFSPGGGFVWNAVHNIQGNTPVENMLAMLEALRR